MKNKIRIIGALCLAVIWGALTVLAWFSPADEYSLSERRYLKQAPDVSSQNILSGQYMSSFEGYTTDQFPLRDTFRQLKAIFHQYALMQSDNNDLYITDGYIAKMDYPLNQEEVSAAIRKFTRLYENMLMDSGCNVYLSVIPDKSYYTDSHHLSMDHEDLFLTMQEKMPYAQYIDITSDLDLSSYYRTDTHWRQETLIPVAQTLCEAMGMTAPTENDFTAEKVKQPFYGVYYGQAALPVEPDEMYLMQSDKLNSCIVGIHDGKKWQKVDYKSVYDLEKLDSKDMYETYLSGTQAAIKIVNPNAATDRTLVIFRDSFGSSLAPLLVQGYRTVTLVDVRYTPSAMLENFLDFHGQDVLFLYSTLVLNNSSQMQ